MYSGCRGADVAYAAGRDECAEDEDRFAEAELRSDLVHVVGVQPAGVQDDAGRVAKQNRRSKAISL